LAEDAPRPEPQSVGTIRRYFGKLFFATSLVPDDNAQVMETLWSLYESTPFAGKQVHDANIVATMFSYGLDTLVTVCS
jgi:hypothetical protein